MAPLTSATRDSGQEATNFGGEEDFDPARVTARISYVRTGCNGGFLRGCMGGREGEWEICKRIGEKVGRQRCRDRLGMSRSFRTFPSLAKKKSPSQDHNIYEWKPSDQISGEIGLCSSLLAPRLQQMHSYSVSHRPISGLAKSKDMHWDGQRRDPGRENDPAPSKPNGYRTPV